MIDKSIRQYYESGQLVQPRKGRPGYQGEKMYFDEKETPTPKNLGADITELENWMSENPKSVQQKHINYVQALKVAQHNKALEEDPNRPGLRVGQLWEDDKTKEDDLLKGTTIGALKKGRELADAPDYVESILHGEKGIKEISKDPKFKGIRKIGEEIMKKTVGDLTATSLIQKGTKKAVMNFAAKKLGLGGLFGIPGLILGWLFDKTVAKVKGKAKAKVTGLGITAVDPITGEVKKKTQAQKEADKELQTLEKRKDYMWDRMLEGKSYSEENLIDVINKTAKIKGYHDAMDMEIINKLEYEHEGAISTTLPKELEYEHEGAISTTLPKELEYEHEGAISTTLPKELEYEHEGAISTTPPPAPVYTGDWSSPGGGGNGGVNGGMGKGQDPGGGTAGSPFFRGGRIDKALRGRSRDI